ncbi:protein enabled homolog isoform X1 [Helicoverpa armigera]|uniref:protein enabled homolog isoform X1 n=1 Tax=Helicoverpa armigera TaxID=29058 RepID=UPI000B3A6F5F|nr:protein enabled homolog isoform X1 [Helicoverpa armigera]
MSVRVDHRDRDRFSRHSSRASVDLAFPSSSTRDHSFRSVHSARVPRAASDDLMVPVRTLRSASCRVAPGAPHRLRRHHSSAAECERARRSRRHTLELPNSRGPSVRSRSPEPPPPPPEPEIPPEDAGKEARRRRVVAAVAASFFALALASVLVVVVTLTHSSVLRAHNQTANSPGERAHDARRPPGGSLKSHPVVGVALTPRYSPRPRLDNVRPAAAPPEEPAEPDPEPSSTAEPPEPPAPLRLAVSAAPAGPT